jgi:hypothetical protein
MGTYDVALVCLNGHAVNDSTRSQPQHSSPRCKKCGQPTTDRCPDCSTPIRGYYRPEDGVYRLYKNPWHPPAYCHQCGKPYAWTERRAAAIAEAIAEVDELTEAEREKLTKSIPDVLAETPNTETAIVRFKKAIAKAGKLGGKLLYDVLTNVAAEGVVKSLSS